MKRYFYLMLMMVPVFLVSCQKEISLETGGRPGDSTTSPTTNDCKLANIIEYDKTTGKSTYAYLTTFNSDHKLTVLDAVDSSAGVIYSSFALTYPTGKIQLDAKQFFVTGSDGKVTEFHGFQDPENKLGYRIIAKYTYNASGQLTLKTIAYDSLPNATVLQYKFTYSGGNLVKQDVEGFYLGSFVRFSTADFTYDATKTVKKFLYVYGGSPELNLFQPAIISGTENTNPVTKIVVSDVNFLQGNTLTVSSTTNFSNYVIDSRGYVQSFEVTGDDYNEGNLYSDKRYRLTYHCY